MALFCIISLLLYLVEQGPKTYQDQLNRIVYLTAYFTRYIGLLFLVICCFLTLVSNVVEILTVVVEILTVVVVAAACSWIKLIMWLTWFAGGVILSMIALLSSGFFGWTPSLQRLGLVMLLHVTINSDSVQFLYTTVIRVVYMLHIQELYLMSRTGYCFITSMFSFPRI